MEPCHVVTTIDLIYFNAGGGHRAAARALQEVMALRPEPWEVRTYELFDLIDPNRRFKKTLGFAPEDYYNKRLALGWTLGLAEELKILQGLIRLGHGFMVRRLTAHWRKTRPDIVVSVIPNFNRALHESVASALPGVPYVTVLTDMADMPPRFWIEAPSGQHLVCGTPQAVAQAKAAGHPASHIHPTSGMILRPDFYSPLAVDREREFERLGLDPGRPTGVVMFGGHGSKAMLKIARLLGDVQLILMCGRNPALASALNAEAGKAAAPRAVVGFTTEVRRHLQVADFFIGKPGPASLSEAVHLGLPVITILNAWTMPQERFNAEWVRTNDVGVVASSVRGIRAAVQQVLGRLDELRRNVKRLDNTAIFEVPVVLDRILNHAEVPLDAWVGQAGHTQPVSNAA